MQDALDEAILVANDIKDNQGRHIFGVGLATASMSRQSRPSPEQMPTIHPRCRLRTPTM
ncbi:MAG: hypothetical protein R3C44_21455 [Chloroflexota bacterium]